MPPPAPTPSSLIGGAGGALVRVRRRGKRQAESATMPGIEADERGLPLTALPANNISSNELCLVVGGVVTEQPSPATVCVGVSCQTDASEACFMCASARALADGLRRELGQLQLQNAKVWMGDSHLSIPI